MIHVRFGIHVKMLLMFVNVISTCPEGHFGTVPSSSSVNIYIVNNLRYSPPRWFIGFISA